MPHPLAAFYRRKRVLVTAHTGFQGGWLVAWLKLLGAQVLGYGLPPSTRPNFFDAILLDRGITSVFGDVRDRNALANAFTDFQPEIVIHCAWHSGQQRALREPVETFATNVMGAVHVLDESRLTASVRSLLLATDQVCGANSNILSGNCEDDTPNGDNPYTAAIKAAELASSAYQHAFFQNRNRAIATAHLANPIGGGDWAEERLVPNIVREITSEGPPPPNCRDGMRQWQHVLESSHALLVLGQSLFENGHSSSGSWNFALEQAAISERELAEKLVKAWGAEVPFASPGEAFDGDHSHILNSGKAQSQLGWRAIFELDEAIAWTIEWYRAFYADPASAWRTTEEQIQQYMNRVS
jgi:CDP-glucose 4,6-dehydratase